MDVSYFYCYCLGDPLYCDDIPIPDDEGKFMTNLLPVKFFFEMHKNGNNANIGIRGFTT